MRRRVTMPIGTGVAAIALACLLPACEVEEEEPHEHVVCHGTEITNADELAEYQHCVRIFALRSNAS